MAAFGSVLTLGEGYTPGGAMGQQLAFMTRRSLFSEVYSQMYTAGPTAVGLLANGIEETGGIDQLAVNVQYQQMIQPYWGDYSGSFPEPSPVVGIQPAAWSYAMLMLPIPVYLSEILLQDDQKIQDLVDVRMTDAGSAARDAIATLLWNNTTNYQQLMGVPWAIDDSTNNANWGNIPRGVNTWWQSKRYNIGASITRSLAFLYITGTTKYSGEKPTFAVAGPATWAQLGQDFMPLERYVPSDSELDQYQSAFTAFDVAGVPHFMDPYTPEGSIWYFNTNYISIRIHERCNWEFIPFQSMVPALQVNFTGVGLLLFQMVLTKPKSCSVLFNITGVPLL